MFATIVAAALPQAEKMKMETWLRPNRRALAFGMSIPLAVVILAALFGFGLAAWDSSLVRIGGGGVALLAGLLVVSLALQMRTPRIGYSDGEVVLYLRSGQPYRVPIEYVEAFLLGHGPAMLPGERHENTETTTLVIRIAERADQWQRCETNPSLASWCDGYITIRGTWCERLDIRTVERLNRTLSERKKERDAAQQ